MMRTVITSRNVLVAGLLAMGAVFSPIVAASAAPLADGLAQRHQDAGLPGCLGETKSWLPGALQIDDRSETTLPGGASDEESRAAVPHDCALV